MKKILGTLVAVGAVMAMAVGVQAAEFSVSSTAASDGTATVPVVVTAATDGETISGYVVTLTYDSNKITPVASDTADAQGSTCYATVDDTFATDNYVLVSDIVSTESDGTQTLAVAWASSEAVALTGTSAADNMATVEFTVDESATEDVAVTVNVAAVTSDGETLETGYTVASGEITIGTSYIYGDADGDGDVSAADASVVLQYVIDSVTLDGKYFTQANVDGDEDVTAADASLILQYVIDSITEFPVEQTAE